jgi:ribonuclease-3
LMRLTQTKGIDLPEYKILSQEGPPHKRIFTIQVVLLIDGKKHQAGIGSGSNKKDAEQLAAMNTLLMFDESELSLLAGRDLI